MTQNNKSQDLKVYDELKNRFKLLGLPIEKEVAEDNVWCFTSGIKLRDIYSMPILVTFDLYENTVVIGASLSHAIPPGKRRIVSELINLINMRIKFNTFEISPETGVIELHSNYFVTANPLNTDHFKMLLIKLIGNAHKFHWLIYEQAYSKLKPQKLLTKFLKDRGEYI